MSWTGYVISLQMTYGAVMLSFLGGVHWGLAMADSKTPGKVSTKQQWIRYTSSIIPPLIAWSSIVVTPLAGMISLLAGFSAMYVADAYAHDANHFPTWYLKLRTYLTIGIILSLGITFIELM